MKEYKTSQRELLMNYIKEHSSELLSADKIANELCRDGKISVSSVYRNLSRLSEEGYIRKVPDESGRVMLYSYLDYSNCDSHFHLSCTACGRVIHMDDDVSADVLRLVFRSSNFKISESKTIFYGTCSDCGRTKPSERNCHKRLS